MLPHGTASKFMCCSSPDFGSRSYRVNAARFRVEKGEESRLRQVRLDL